MVTLSFYEELSKYYDCIFPPEEAQVELISGAVKSGGRILDVACGNGGYSAELYKRGFKVQACDLDKGMVSAAERRFSDLGMEIPVKTADMTELSKVYNEKFDGIFCIGNSIVHLGSIEQVKKTISEMKELLAEGGSLILQIMNFDRVKKFNIEELPEIKNEDKKVSFKRFYNEAKEGKIAFDTVLQVNGQEPLKNSVLLLPIMKDELYNILDSVGFKAINIYGDFKRNNFADNSYVLVAECKK
jgi:Cyclopropane fatty acid synthase and related methyltransferases